MNSFCVGILQCKEKSAFGWPAQAYSEGTDLHPLDKLLQQFLDGLLLHPYSTVGKSSAMVTVQSHVGVQSAEDASAAFGSMVGQASGQQNLGCSAEVLGRLRQG